MNYFAHGRRFVDDPYFLAGTAIPDWLNVADRGVRVRSKHAQPHLQATDERVASVAGGIVQHHADDAWFHESRAFHELSWQFTREIKLALPVDEGFRPSFLGHILVEILLDAELIAREPGVLEEYYRALGLLDGEAVEAALNLMAPRPTQHLARLIPLFVQERFLWDYADDAKLCFRLNQVMRRVQLPALPPEFAWRSPSLREQIAARRDELLESPILP